MKIQDTKPGPLDIPPAEPRRDIVGELLLHFTRLPKPGTLAKDLTDRDKVALAMAFGLRAETIFSPGTVTLHVATPFAITDAEGGGYNIITKEES